MEQNLPDLIFKEYTIYEYFTDGFKWKQSLQWSRYRFQKGGEEN